MESIKTFLKSKGCPVETWGDDQCRQVAKALGYELPDVAVTIEAYTRQDGKEFMYVKAGVKGSRNGIMAQVNAGKALTAEGKAKARSILTGLANGAADLLATLDA